MWTEIIGICLGNAGTVHVCELGCRHEYQYVDHQSRRGHGGKSEDLLGQLIVVIEGVITTP